MKHSFNDGCSFSTLIAGRISVLKEISSRVLAKMSVLSMELEYAHIKQYQELAATSAILAQLNSELVALSYLHKIEHGEIALNCVEYSIGEFLETQAAFVKLIANAEHTTTVEVECDKLLAWDFDQLLLAAAIRAAAMNALEFTNSKILFTAAVDKDFLKISVEDDGAGLPLTLLNSANNSNMVGSVNSAAGVGLHFAQTIAAMHCVANKQGYVELSDLSSIGGSAFTIYLPAES